VKEFIIPVNNEAHSRALETIVGPETAQLVLKAYKAIDSAMVFGYERGTRDTLASTAEEAAESREKFSEGYDAGYSEGYVDGVQDARLCPDLADEEVARLCGDDEFDESNISDSGDTQGYDINDRSCHGNCY
jgi:flagellar biosynthesis/type III secretory pathway protein FliH